MNTLMRVLREYPALGPLDPVIVPVAYRGFSGAVVWAVTTLTGHYAVRRWPDRGIDSARITELHQLLCFLRDGGVDFIAIPVRSRDGRTLVELDGCHWQVEPWLPGDADLQRPPTRKRLAVAMAALAQWHLAAARYRPSRNSEQPFHVKRSEPSPAVCERRVRLQSISVAPIRAWSPTPPLSNTDDIPSQLSHLRQLVIRHATKIRAELQLAERVAVPLQPVLRDVWREHVLFSGDDVTGLIDPSACRTESVAADLARLLGSYLGDDVAEWDFAIAEYQRHRPLSPAECGLIPVLDRSGVLLSAVTWLEWLGGQCPELVGDPRVLPRLRELATRLERF